MRSDNFSGATYVSGMDFSRLTAQLRRVYDVMKDGVYRTVEEVAELTGFKNDRSLEAQLRNLRKPQFGGYDGRLNPDGHMVLRRNRKGIRGLSEYKLMITREHRAPDAPKSLTEAFNHELARQEKIRENEAPKMQFRKDLFG